MAPIRIQDVYQTILTCPKSFGNGILIIYSKASGDTITANIYITYENQIAKTVFLRSFSTDGRVEQRSRIVDINTSEDPKDIDFFNSMKSRSEPQMRYVCGGTPDDKKRFEALLKKHCGGTS